MGLYLLSNRMQRARKGNEESGMIRVKKKIVDLFIYSIHAACPSC